MITMKKYILILPIIVIAVTLLIWKLNDKAEYNFEIESFVLIKDIPYMVSEGTAYYWNNDNGAWIVCKEGVRELFRGEYISFEIQNEAIKDISGQFILTEEGNVYEIGNWNFGEYFCRQVSEDKFIEIDSYGMFCVGIRENNTVVMWSDWGSTRKSFDFTEWKDVKEIVAGFNYCVGLTMNGEILYADYDKDRETEVSKRLEGIKAEHITCCFETIAVIKNDLTVEMIDLSE